MTLNLLIPHSWLLLIHKALLFAARQEPANGIFEGTIDNVVRNFTLYINNVVSTVLFQLRMH
jgi:hypothetical protein